MAHLYDSNVVVQNAGAQKELFKSNLLGKASINLQKKSFHCSSEYLQKNSCINRQVKPSSFAWTCSTSREVFYNLILLLTSNTFCKYTLGNRNTHTAATRTWGQDTLQVTGRLASLYTLYFQLHDITKELGNSTTPVSKEIPGITILHFNNVHKHLLTILCALFKHVQRIIISMYTRWKQYKYESLQLLVT